MAMQRRHVLRLLGAAIAAPAIPVGASAGMSQSAVQTAIAHAQKYPVISVTGLAKRGGFSLKQARALIKELAARDMVKLVGPSVSGTPRAASKIMVNDPWGLGRTSEERTIAKSQSKADQARQARAQATGTDTPRRLQVDLDPLLSHLRQICTRHGMALHPRCLQGGAA